MALSTLLSPLLEGPVRSRGRNLYFAAAVRMRRGDRDSAEATVRGTRSHEVRLRREGSAVRLHCTCHHFAASGPCKHLWAAVLAAERAGHLGSFAPEVFKGPLQLVEEGADGPHEDDDELDPEPAHARAEEPRLPPEGPPAALDWGQAMDELRRSAAAPPSRLTLTYEVDLSRPPAGGMLPVNLFCSEPSKSGRAVQRPFAVTPAILATLPDAADRAVLAALLGAQSQTVSGYALPWGHEAVASFRVASPVQAQVAEAMARTGRCRLRTSEGAEPTPLLWDDRGPYEVALRLLDDAPEAWQIVGTLRRAGEDALPLGEVLFLGGAVVVVGGRLAPLSAGGALPWIPLLARGAPILVHPAQQERFLDDLYALRLLPPIELPASLRLEEVRVPPRPRLEVRSEPGGGSVPLRARLEFAYDAGLATLARPGAAVLDRPGRRLYLRDEALEADALAELLDRGFKPTRVPDADLIVSARAFLGAAPALLAAGWQVQAHGKLYRRPGAFRLGVASGIDWFDLEGGCDFDGVHASLPSLLAALARGDGAVVLGDGSFGILPEEWLRRIGLFAQLGKVSGDHVRFKPSQVALLDAMLAAQPDAHADAPFERLRETFAGASRIEPMDPPPAFRGALRGYQREGLAWLHFLERTGLGGCLADDMGLGKTVQVLALLASRGGGKGTDPGRPPSLVVAPRSVIHNWKNEAARFAPGLRVLDHLGAARRTEVDAFADADLVLTTYGTLRRDIGHLARVRFDHAILDEAQTIKNPSSDAARAACLLQADHRLALSGTPVENHVGELWSIFEFLNPGMLGRSSAFGSAARRDADPTSLAALGRALRPFILRRTKAQVAQDLPARTEDTIVCELDGPQRAFYDELRRHYQASLLARVASQGLAKSKLHVLEALLRLRQAACHPGLVDPSRKGEPSAKLDTLLEQLAEVRAEGHKALVFSQFTSFLGLLRARLDGASPPVPYEYLDGSTVDREARVERFQNDPACPLFLVSLKAGGLGLNLTAAEYVFLLDPWWNPAVEAQAIDRAHRIGQTRAVFAYRLLCKDTIEEKIAELQVKKRALAEGVISADESLMRELTPADLELLLA